MAKKKKRNSYLPVGYDEPQDQSEIVHKGHLTGHDEITEAASGETISEPANSEHSASNEKNDEIKPIEPEGMECKNCGCREFRVGRVIPRGKKIYRYRYCRQIKSLF